jgi:hypothetical protein
MITYSHTHGNYEANSWTNNFAVTGVLIAEVSQYKHLKPENGWPSRSALETNDGKWHEVAHLEGIDRGQM